jgi:hypothetical protein
MDCCPSSLTSQILSRIAPSKSAARLRGGAEAAGVADSGRDASVVEVIEQRDCELA